MPRKPRLEISGGVYHLINRGNYREHIFESERTRAAFLRCYDEASARTGWCTFAWAVMINHFHTATLTPQPNLIAGMQWWLGTFAKRFNRLRREHGHLFQGRYKSIRVDPETRLGSLCHYIHLNPVRAKVVTVEDLPDHPWTSIYWMVRPKLRPRWYDPRPALAHAGSLADTRNGWKQYLEYLRWLSTDKRAQEVQQFEEMDKGAVLGSPAFLADILEEYRRATPQAGQFDLEGTNSLQATWQRQLDELLAAMGKSLTDAATARKSEPWKLAIATVMKSSTTVTNRWLSERLNLGALHETSRNISAWSRAPDPTLLARLHAPTTHHKA